MSRDLGNWLMGGKKKPTHLVLEVLRVKETNSFFLGVCGGGTLYFTPVTLTVTPMNVLV